MVHQIAPLCMFENIALQLASQLQSRKPSDSEPLGTKMGTGVPRHCVHSLAIFAELQRIFTGRRRIGHYSSQQEKQSQACWCPRRVPIYSQEKWLRTLSMCKRIADTNRKSLQVGGGIRGRKGKRTTRSTNFRSFEKRLADRGGWRKESILHHKFRPFSAPFSLCPLASRTTHNSGGVFLLYFRAVGRQPPPANPFSKPLTIHIKLTILLLGGLGPGVRSALQGQMTDKRCHEDIKRG